MIGSRGRFFARQGACSLKGFQVNVGVMGGRSSTGAAGDKAASAGGAEALDEASDAEEAADVVLVNDGDGSRLQPTKTLAPQLKKNNAIVETKRHL